MSTRARLHRAEARVGHDPRRRAAALGAIVCEIAGSLILLALVVLHPMFAVATIVVVAAAVACGFAALVMAGPRRWFAAAAAGALAVLAVGLLLFWGERADLSVVVAPAALALLAGGAALARYALRHPPPAVDLAHVGPSRVADHPVLIVNPRSGGGKAETFDLAGRAAELGIETIVMGPDDDLEQLARDAVARGADVLGMAGGDGSQALVLSIAVEHDLRFVCIPSGTRNHFALDLGLDRNDPTLALAAFVDGEERRVDHGVVNGRVFVNNVALGLYAAIVDQDGYRDAKISTTLELLPTLIEKQGPWFDLRFDVPDHGHLDGTSLLLVSNNPYAIDTAVNQRESLQGGELGILTVNPERLSDLLQITVLAAARRTEAARALWAWTAREFVVESGETEIVAGIDGERVTLTPPLRFRIVPDAARVLVPPGTRIGLEEQIAAGSTYGDLLALAFNLGRDDGDGSDDVRDDRPGGDDREEVDAEPEAVPVAAAGDLAAAGDVGGPAPTPGPTPTGATDRDPAEGAPAAGQLAEGSSG